MKKLYTTILASMLGTAALMADEGTFSFVRNGAVVPNGSTVTITEVEVQDFGDNMFAYDMQSGLFIHNNEETAQKLSIKATGIENYEDIQVCPDGNCLPWSNGVIEADFKNPIPADGLGDAGIHIGYMDMEGKGFSFKGSITVRAYCSLDDEDFTEITLVFDSSASSLSKVKSSQKLEVFNICGRLVGNSATGLKKGIYIFRQGDVSRKVVIK